VSFHARDLADKDFVRMTKESSVLEAARAMNSKKRGYVVVLSEAGAPVGIATEWDFLSKVVAEDRDPSTTSLEEIISTDLVAVKAGDTFDAVAQLMVDRGIRRVLVLEDGKMVGVVTAKMILYRLKDYVDRVSSQIAKMQSPFM
jgi:signal-transduction protein with cAMP-binding, CBS, and nucleotidyltransferase domain